MNVELIPGLSNVIRFPVEERLPPTVELLMEIGPDAREVFAVAESFHLDAVDPNLQHETDRETARHIAEHLLPLKLNHETLTQRLGEMLDPVVARAAVACKEHRIKAKAAVAAHDAAHHAKINGGYWLERLEEQADTLTREASVLFLEAYARVLEMIGVNRAIGFARRGETWKGYDPVENQAEWLAQLETLKPRRPVESRPV